jgi:predicted secreted hydrolase
VQFPRTTSVIPARRSSGGTPSALTRDAAGTRYLVFFALFSSGGNVLAAHQVTNLATGAIVDHGEEPGIGSVGTSSLDVQAGTSRVSYSPRTNTWSFSAGGPGHAVSLRQRPTKPYTLHGGGTGRIRQSVAGTSFYYPRRGWPPKGPSASGRKTVALTGQSWLDHQWGDFRDDPRGFNWDWFSCRFDDGTELMLYQFRDRQTGRPLDRYRTARWVPANGTARGITGFAADHGRRALWAVGRTWLLDWHLKVPSLGITETVRAIVPDQLVRNTILPTFWEGASAATGSRKGTCVVELSYRRVSPTIDLPLGEPSAGTAAPTAGCESAQR